MFKRTSVGLGVARSNLLPVQGTPHPNTLTTLTTLLLETLLHCLVSDYLFVAIIQGQAHGGSHTSCSYRVLHTSTCSLSPNPSCKWFNVKLYNQRISEYIKVQITCH